MAKDVVTLTIVGAPEHRGHAMAHAFVEKVDRFLKTFGAFERAFLKARARQTDFEIVMAAHNSPLAMDFNPVPRVRNYQPDIAVLWTLEQWEKIANGQQPDPLVDDELIGDVAELASNPSPTDYQAFSVSFRARKIELDQRAEANARSLRAKALAERSRLPWRAGVSLGQMTGELRTVLDARNERQIVILPPVGPNQVRCVFPEQLRDRIKDYLFQFVRVHGLLHYNSESAFPHLIELDNIESLDVGRGRPHFLDGKGLFKDCHYPLEVSDL